MGERMDGVSAMPKRGPRNYINLGVEDAGPGAPGDAVRRAFAHRLYTLMVAKGWNQSDLARALTTEMGKNFGKDNVSNYVRGVSLPTGPRLLAIAKVFDVAPEELVVAAGRPSAESKNPKLDVRFLDDSYAWLKVNRRVSRDLARKIVNLLEDEKESEE